MRGLPLAMSALLILSLAPLSVGLPPPSARTFLAVHEPGDATLSGLLAAGFDPCDPILPSGDCFVAVTPSAFATVVLEDHEAIFVGTHDGAGAVYPALVARTADIEAYVDVGGSLVTLAEPQSGDYAFVPNDAPWPFYMFDTLPSDTAWVTSYGSSHPALVGVTNASVSGWGPSFERMIGERPYYMAEILRGSASTGNWTQNGSIGLAGNFGDGCVVMTMLQADRTASGLHDPTHATDAADLISALLAWGLDCTQQPPFPIAYTGTIRISLDPATGSTPTVTATANLACGALSFAAGEYSVSCYPNQAPPTYAYYACVGSQVTAWQLRLDNLTGASLCGGSINAQCSTGATGIPSTSTGWCTQMSGLQLGPFPLRCVARPGNVLSNFPAWAVVCGNADP